LDSGRQVVNQSGYQLKKGKSRSKTVQGSEQPEISTKRCKTSESLRIKRISELDDDIKDYSDRLNFKEKDMNKLLMVETTNYVISSQKRWQN